jgi:hypothetical protein
LYALLAVGVDGWKDESGRFDKHQKCSIKMASLGYPSHPQFSCYIHMGKTVAYLVILSRVTDFWDFEEMGYLEGGS